MLKYILGSRPIPHRTGLKPAIRSNQIGDIIHTWVAMGTVIVLCGRSNVALGMFVMGFGIICGHCLISPRAQCQPFTEE